MSVAAGSKRNNDCPCGSGASYTKCCKPFHLRHALPETAEQLMRSRYVAFAKRLDSYLLSTWAPETRPESLHLSRDQVFTSLEIHAASEGSATDAGATVDFTAHYTISGRPGVLSEHSRFRRLTEENDRWVYVDGDVD